MKFKTSNPHVKPGDTVRVGSEVCEVDKDGCIEVKDQDSISRLRGIPSYKEMGAAKPAPAPKAPEKKEAPKMEAKKEEPKQEEKKAFKKASKKKAPAKKEEK